MDSINTIFLIGVVLGLVGCSTRPEGVVPIPEAVVPMYYPFVLTDAEITNLIQSARSGDRDAAFKLYEYYDMVKLDRDASLIWLTTAAKNGHTVAQYNLGMTYDGELFPDLKDIDRAKYWFQRAAAGGDAEASRKLQKLDARATHGTP
jgi:TPR repeat protein